jgi:transposase-like protein
MSGANSKPHYFDCPSCKAFATLQLLGQGRRAKRVEYECSQCQSRYSEKALEREAGKRQLKRGA